MSKVIKAIAEMISEDLGMAATMPGTTGTSSIASGPTSSSAMNNQVNMQRKIEKDIQAQNKKILAPQINKLQKSVKKVGSEVTQSKEGLEGSNQNMDDLDRELTTINSLIANIQKTV